MKVIKENKLQVIRRISFGDLMYSMMAVIKNTVLYIYIPESC